jgi:hypothetical protein
MKTLRIFQTSLIGFVHRVSSELRMWNSFQNQKLCSCQVAYTWLGTQQNCDFELAYQHDTFKALYIDYLWKKITCQVQGHQSILIR